MAIIDKLESIANAIRGKTHKEPKLSLVDMVNEINNEWQITCYIKDFYIQDDGNHNNLDGNHVDRDSDWDYFDDEPIGPDLSKSAVIYSYTPEGHVVLTARPMSEIYENIEWTLAHIPEGSNISIYKKHFDNAWNGTGHAGKYESCVLLGIDRYCKIFIDCGTKDAANQTIILNIHIYDI